MDARQIRAAAIARVQARRRPAEYKTVQAGGSDTRMQVDRPGAGAFLPPSTASEWLDYRIAYTPPALGPWTSELYQLAEAARDGAAAAVKAVRAFRSLTPWDQWNTFTMLQNWRSDMLADVGPILRAVLAEWEHLELAMAEPTDVPLPVTPEPKRQKVVYRSRYGNPASLAY
jgi:hypothetical protein